VGSLENYESWEEYRQLSDVSFPGFWPPGAEPVVREFLKTRYDPKTMPQLHVNVVGGVYDLIGWKQSDHPEGIGLLEAARGFPLTDTEERVTRCWPNAVWCPRCWEDAYVPEDASDKEEGYEAGFLPPALSRTTRGENDTPIWVCSACGQAEAMEDWGGHLTPPEAWPVGRSKGFGMSVVERRVRWHTDTDSE